MQQDSVKQAQNIHFQAKQIYNGALNATKTHPTSKSLGLQKQCQNFGEVAIINLKINKLMDQNNIIKNHSLYPPLR